MARAKRRGDAERFWTKVDKSGECWLWTAGMNRQGYGKFWVDGRDMPAHRFSYQLAHGPIPDGKCVCHNCPGGDNPACVNPAHLWLGTDAENTADRHNKGRDARGERHASRTKPERVARGERHPMAKLTRQDAETIRRLYAAGGVSQRELARRFGMSPSQIGNITSGKHWRDTPGEVPQAA